MERIDNWERILVGLLNLSITFGSPILFDHLAEIIDQFEELIGQFGKIIDHFSKLIDHSSFYRSIG
ncbi:hypothetical protein HNO89_000340 [Sporosarcina luteola]|nr:hypothetical protein [Sporosarcina luteola]